MVISKQAESRILVPIVLFGMLFYAFQLPAATPLKRIRLSYSAFAYANPPFWIANDLKLFQKYGLESELVYVSGARSIQAMLGCRAGRWRRYRFRGRPGSGSGYSGHNVHQA